MIRVFVIHGRTHSRSILFQLYPVDGLQPYLSTSPPTRIGGIGRSTGMRLHASAVASVTH
jgi:hypothetical protein